VSEGWFGESAVRGKEREPVWPVKDKSETKLQKVDESGEGEREGREGSERGEREMGGERAGDMR